jgi:anti-sigma factor RsiW
MEVAMECEGRREQIDLYLDGELSSAESAGLITHSRACATCAAELLARTQLKRAVHLAGKRYEPSAQLRNKIATGVGQKDSRSARQWRWIAVAASIIVLASGALYQYIGSERMRQERVYSELADLHVATLASPTPVDVVSSDRHTVKPWFQGKIPFTFNLPELQGSEFSLLGGRVTYLEQTSGAHLIFQVRKHEISVFILPERGEVASLPDGLRSRMSFNVESWTANGLRYCVLGDANADEILALSKLLKDAR